MKEETSQKRNKYTENKLNLVMHFYQEWVCFSGHSELHQTEPSAMPSQYRVPGTNRN